MENTGKISIAAAILMCMNIMIGAGIFFGPQLMAARSESLSFLGWLLVAVLLSPIIINIADAARIFPGEGGFFNYCRSTLGETGAFMATWSFFLAYLGTTGVQTSVIREALINDYQLLWIQTHPLLFNLLAATIFSLFNLLSISIISKIQSSMTIVKLIPLIFVISLLCGYYNPSFQIKADNILNLGLAVPIGIFSFNGWEACCSIGHLIKGGSSKVPLVIFSAFGIVVTIYTIFHLSILHIMGVDNLVKFGAASFPLFLGLSDTVVNTLKIAILYAFMISYTNSLYGVYVTNVTTLHSLAHKDLILRGAQLSRLNNNERPPKLIALYGLLSFGLISLIPNTTILVGFTGIGIVCAFIITMASLFIVFYQRRNYLKLFQVLLGFGSSSILLYFSFMSMGNTFGTRFLYLIPLLFSYTAGYVMLRIKQAEHERELVERMM